jgi:D-arabinose 5-phosphate isomerase GutQ
VILCGVGKSGLIAAKISATLSQSALHLSIYQQATPLMVI